MLSPMWVLLQLLPRDTYGLFVRVTFETPRKSLILTKRSSWMQLALQTVVLQYYYSSWTSPISHPHVNYVWLVTPTHAADGAVLVQCSPAWLRNQPSQAHLSALSEW